AEGEELERLAEETIEGEVVKRNQLGIFVQIEEELRGLVHSSEIENDTRRYEEISVGDRRTFEITSIDPEHHRLGLILAA
ncbi:MAG: S1 RNA-binding domain-containing protein, partial [Candidatus Paceibacteria bacterium]